MKRNGKYDYIEFNTLGALLVLFMFFGINIQMNAQGKPINVQVTVFQPNPNLEDRKNNPTVPMSGCDVYVFRSKVDAQRFLNNTMSLYGDGPTAFVDIKENWEEKVQTDTYGNCELNAVGSNWYVVAVKEPFLSDGVISINGETDLVIETKSQVKELQEVKKEGKRKRRQIVSRNLAIGDTRIIKADVGIFPADCNSTQRYGLSPFSIVISKDMGFTSGNQNMEKAMNNVFKNLRPYIIDGESFSKTQLRKMGYDYKNDPLYPYVDKTQVIRSHDLENDSMAFHVYDVLRPTQENAIYPTYGYLWYENYGNLVITDTVLIDAGYSKNPMRFIDFSFPSVDINKQNYHVPPKKEAQKGNSELHIQFVNGKAEVVASDTIGLQQLADITKTLENIYSDPDGRLYSVKIHGYASPEGGRAVNERLCRQRAAYLKDKVSSKLGGVYAEIDGSVATWKDVANLLRADSVADPENISRANQIEEIIASARDEAQIDARIASTAVYKFLKEHEDQYYKPLRKVEISYEFSLSRILSPEEVIERYHQKKEANMPYQFEYLFEYLKDKPKELEPVAKAAMRVGPRVAGKPWALAAYYLAKCYLARDTCDLTILAPYIVLDDYECTKTIPFSRVQTANGCSTLLNSIHVDQYGTPIQYLNDEGIVLEQISMMIKANKIVEAFRLSENLLPDEDPKYQEPKKILECMDGSWAVPEVRDAVAQSSPWNKVVVYAAQDSNPQEDVSFWEDAWNLLCDTAVFKMNAPREMYMKAVLAARLFHSAKNWLNRTDKVPVPKKFFDISNYSVLDRPYLTDESYPWGMAMVKVCEMEPSYIFLLKFDGEFSQNYRDGFATYWNDIHPDKMLK